MKRKNRSVTDDDLLENVAAISAAMHSDREAYDCFYRRYAPMLGGFCGIYALCVSMARVFSSVSPADWEDCSEPWQEAVDCYATLTLALAKDDAAPDPANPRLQRRLAGQSIRPRPEPARTKDM